ncbi:N-acetylmuramoyl-L-alanine amidase [Tropicimonas sp. S265A]|uniref:N-acetylmuramoyl-L-alanine amidase n=1 Tax=Tropicimonas sp. S265A TaxID=3415134 RepID=UPI003C7BD639
MTSAEAACDWLCNPEAQVSAHYLIARDGHSIQMVDEAHRAWHAGAGQWGAITDVNSHSIGIELDNDGSSPFSEPLLSALEALLAAVMDRWSIPPAGVIGHSDMAPGRKIDPGPRFDWRRLARQGLAIWPDAEPDLPPDAARFEAALSRFGMTHPADAATRLAAFRSRFRPGASGPLATADMALAQTLADRFGVDARPASA